MTRLDTTAPLYESKKREKIRSFGEGVDRYLSE